MPKYLLKASYNAEGVRGVMKEGGSKREAAARALVKSLGGKVESFYFCHGDADAIVICEFPDIASALAGVMAVNASGAVVASTTPLISAAEMDAAAKKTGKYPRARPIRHARGAQCAPAATRRQRRRHRPRCARTC